MKFAAPWIAALSLLAAAGAARAQDEEKILRAFEERYRAAAEKAAAVTVSLRVDRIKDSVAPPPPRGMRGFGGGDDPFGKRPANSPVTGLILEADGWIATSYFNIAGDLKEIEATLPDGRVLPAKLVGYQTGADIALLKVEATGLAVLPRVDPHFLKTGEPVVAVGRAPDGRGLTVNPGILSAPGRHAGKTVQVDCRLNFGNVGGPLVDLEGRLIGMTCKITTARTDIGQNSGIGFALISTHLDSALPALKKGEKTTSGSGRPFLGIIGEPNDTETDGARIKELHNGGSAEKSGLKVDDVIIAMDGVRIRNFEELRTVIMKKKVGETVKVKLRREGQELEFDVVLSERPGE
jgi:S1-C subfamily serine protease